MPDTIIDMARQSTEYNTKLDARQQALGGIATPAAGAATPLADLKQIGEARGTVLGVKLDQVCWRPDCMGYEEFANGNGERGVLYVAPACPMHRWRTRSQVRLWSTRRATSPT